jgi:hypothetical protein
MQIVLILILCVANLAHAADALEGTRKKIPIDQVEKEMVRPGLNDVSFTLQIAKLYATAYATGDTMVPVISRDGPTSHFLQLDFREINSRKRQIPKVVSPVSEARREYLNKAATAFLAVLKKNPNASAAKMGIAWCSLQNGKKQEAHDFLKDLLKDFGEKNVMLELAPSGLVSIDLPVQADSYSIQVAGKEIEQKNIFSRLVFEHTRQVTKKGIYKILNWENESGRYLQQPTRSNFDALVTKINSDIPSDSEDLEVIQDRIGEPMKKKDLVKKIGEFHRVIETSGAAIKSAANKALTAKTPNECDDLVGSASFGDGIVPLKLVCLARLAFKDKNWGYCRKSYENEMTLDLEFQRCIEYLSYRSKSEELCNEVDKYLKTVTLQNFQVYDCKKKAKRIEMKMYLGSKFFSESDWTEKDIHPTLGVASFDFQADDEGNVKLKNLDLHQNYRSSQEDVRAEVFDAAKTGKIDKTVSVEVAIKDRAGAVVGKERLNLPILNFDTGLAPANFTFEQFYEKADGEALDYYLATLDPVKDKSEIENLRQAAWRELKQREMLPELID